MPYEYVDINVSDVGVIPESTQIALIDADTIVYIACGSAEKKLGPSELFTDEESAEIVANGGVEWEGELVISDLKEAIGYAKAKIEKILELTGCKKCELHFTAGRENFRYSLYSLYKAHRIGRSPIYLMEVKEELCKIYKGKIHYAIEADDAVAYLKRRYPEKYLVCAVDKDILKGLEGKHFNYYESAKYNISMKYVETDMESARLFPYRQAMIGDKSDNIYGIPRVGEKRSKDLIPDGCENPMELLIKYFKEAGLTEADAKLNYALTYMGDEKYCKELENEK